MPYTLQTACNHENCDCSATLQGERGPVTFFLKNAAVALAQELQEETETPIEIVYHEEASLN